jgi:hypothetical protein
MLLQQERIRNSIKDLKKIKDSLIKAKSSFTIRYIGNIAEFHFDSTGRTRRFGAFKPKVGMHIPKMVLHEVDKRLKEGEYKPVNTDQDKNVKTIMYNYFNINRNAKQHCVSVDINACYWNTAHNLGIISDHTFEMGLTKEAEWKEARNVSIGSLGAEMFFERFEEGVMIKSWTEKRFGANCRLDVMDHVWAMANRIVDKLGDDFLMFLTDCFFVPIHRLDDLQKYVKEEGYSTKYEDCEFVKVQRMMDVQDREGKPLYTDKVIWYNVQNDKFKFHDFSNMHFRETI